MVQLDTEICVCNNLTLRDIAKCIQDNNFKTLEDVIANEECSIGDKCEACHDEGYGNDGLNIPLVFKMLKKNPKLLA